MQTLRDKHLNKSRWFDLLPSGTLRLKRVSAKAEAQFPRRYRVTLARQGAPALVKQLIAETSPKPGLAEAWAQVKAMVNGGNHA